MSQQTSVQSNLTPAANASDVGRIEFVVRAALAGLRTAMPVKVLEVSNNGGVSPIGTVNVQPLVSGVDGSGNAWPHGTIYNVPYMRIQGGSNAVIIDPQVGDIGIATVCDRDISTVKGSSSISSPGSNRRHDMSDIVYLMTIIGVAPTQYVQFSSSGIKVLSPQTVTIQAPTITLQGNVQINGNIGQAGQGGPGTASFSAPITAPDFQAPNANLNTHVHSDPQGGNVGLPHN